MSVRSGNLLALALIFCVALTGCRQEAATASEGHDAPATRTQGRGGFAAPAPSLAVSHAIAVMAPTKGNNVSGVLYFVSEGGGIRVAGEIRGLAPNTTHGFHIHEFGDMTSPDGTSMGSHFNPMGTEHGLPDQDVRHSGDMGNITADASGIARVDLTITAHGGIASILGRGVVVHADPDDGGQPTGNAGGRICVGVIGVREPKSIEQDVSL